MAKDLNDNRSYKIYCTNLYSNNIVKDLIIESSQNSIEFRSNKVIFDGLVDFSKAIYKNIDISGISEISTKFLTINSITIPSEMKLLFNSVNNGYIINTSIGIDPNSGEIGRRDAYFTYINVSGGVSTFNNSLYIQKNLLVHGTVNITNDISVNGTSFLSIDTSFNDIKARLLQSFNSTTIKTIDVSATNISISNELYVLKTAFLNSLSLSGQLLSSTIKVPSIFTIDPSGYNNSGTLTINGDLTVRGLQTSITSSIVEISDLAITIASKLSNKVDLSRNNAGLDISNVASLKYNGTNWNFSGGQLFVENNKVCIDVSLVNATDNIELSFNEIKTDFSSSFFTFKNNKDNSFNNVYTRDQIVGSYTLKSAFEGSYNFLKSYIDNSYISKDQFDLSFLALKSNIDMSYVVKTTPKSYDFSLSSFNSKIDLSYTLTSVFKDIHNSLKMLFENSLNSVTIQNVNVATITINSINTRHFTQTFNNDLWNKIGLDISNGPPLTNNNKKVAISNDGKVIAMSTSSHSDISKGRIYVYEILYNQTNQTSSNWTRLGLSSEIIVGLSNDDQFGWDIALSSNGRVVAGSSIVSDASGINCGQVRLFELSSNNVWSQKGSNINGPRINSESGYSISLAGSGNSIAIGAWKDNSNGTNAGAVRVYDFSAAINDWRQKGQTIVGVSGSYEGYATALSLDGQTLASASIIGAQVRTFTISGTTWTSKGIISRTDISFGRAIKLSNNGNAIVIGAPGANTNVLMGEISEETKGGALVYGYQGETTWNQLGQTITGISDGDEFGSSVSISNDGTIISAGSNNNVTNSGYVNVYKYYNNYWYRLGNTLNGISISSSVGIHALAGDGTTLIQSNNTYNSVYGINRILLLNSPNTTISGDLLVTNKAYFKSLKIANRHIFNVDGYSSHYLSSSNINDSIVDYYSDVNSTYNKVFKIDACGNISNYTGFYGSLSDIRLKENILDTSPILEDLLKVRVVNYNLKVLDKTKYIGVVAQELEEIFPELVVEVDPGYKDFEEGEAISYKSVKYSSLSVMLIKALQEQQVLINNLILELEELEKSV